MIRVAVVIVNWNLKAETLDCLTSLARLKLDGIALTTIVVDNGSTDDSVRAIRSKFPKIKIIENRKNLGFTGGNNRGIDLALREKADYIWLLNNDTTVDRQALIALVSAFSDNLVGIAGSKIYFAPGREFHKERYQPSELGKVIWYAGGLIDWNNMYASHRGVDEVDEGQFEETVETPFVTGCSMLVSASVFKAVGKLDDRYFLYLEDLDLSLRAQKAGFKLFYVPNSKVWHKNAGSTSGPGNPLHEYYLTRNRLLVGARFAPLRTKIALLRESLRFLLNGPPLKRQAVRDAILGRWRERYLWQKQN